MGRVAPRSDVPFRSIADSSGAADCSTPDGGTGFAAAAATIGAAAAAGYAALQFSRAGTSSGGGTPAWGGPVSSSQERACKDLGHVPAAVPFSSLDDAESDEDFEAEYCSEREDGQDSNQKGTGEWTDARDKKMGQTDGRDG